MGTKRSIKQEDIISYLLRFGKLKELTDSINNNQNLYAEDWLSCTINSEGKVIVLEGNRRIAACKIMTNPSLIPEDLDDTYKIASSSKETIDSISKIKVVIYDNANDAQNYIAAKHTKFEIKHWEPIEQCNYYYSQYNNGKTIRDIMTNTGDSPKDIQEKIKWFGIFKDIFNVVTEKHPHILIEEVNILPLATKFFPTIAAKNTKIGLKLSYSKDTLKYSAAPERADVYKKILLLIGEAFFVRPKASNSTICERATSDTYRISTEEIKNKQQVQALITDDIRIPGLIKLIQEYKGITVKQQITETAATIDTAPKPSTDDTNASSAPLPKTNSTKQRTVSTDKAPEFFADLKYDRISINKHPGLYMICEEIQHISVYNSGAGYKQFPIASTFLLRSLIEQVLSERAKQMNRYQIKTSKDGKQRSPELGAIIDIYLKDCQNGNYSLFWGDANLASDFNKCFSGYGTKDQLDTVIHNPQNIRPEANFLNSLSNQGLKTIIQGFLDKL